MRYTIDFKNPNVILSVEESFTLIDYISLFTCLLLGIFFALFLWIFAFALLIKIFTRTEYVFNSDTNTLILYFRIFGYLKIKTRKLSFNEIIKFSFSNFDSDKVLIEQGLVTKEWLTLDIILRDEQIIRITKLEPENLIDIHDLYLDLKTYMDDWFNFEIEYGVVKDA